VHDARAVCRADPVARLQQVADGFLGVERSVALQQRGEVEPLEQLHREKRRAVFEASGAEHAAHVHAADLPCELGLAREARQKLRLAR
jgi:hypothetical protein